MNELIDKELAIQTILGEYPDAHYPSWYADIIRRIEPAHESLIDDNTLIVTLDIDDFYNVGRVVLRDKIGIWCKTMYQDVPDIIRCKDCKWYESNCSDCVYAFGGMTHPNEDDYCSYAERRVDE